MPISQTTYCCWVFDFPPGTDDEGMTTHFATEAAARRSLKRDWMAGYAPGIRQMAEPCWIAVCDGECGAEFEDEEGGNHGASRTETEQLVAAYGWTVTKDGEVFCDYDARDCSAADLAVTEQIPGQMVLACNPEDQMIEEAERDGTLRTIPREEAGQ